MADKYVVIYEYNEEVKSCLGVYDSYCMALGKVFDTFTQFVEEQLEEPFNYNISIPQWDTVGNDFMLVTAKLDDDPCYFYIFYYGDKKTGRWEVRE